MTTTTELRTVVVVGNPNVGKSTLFNALTGMRQRVSNYPGVTVAAREGMLVVGEGEPVRVLDLPGTYSLRPAALDEAVVEGVLLGREAQAPDVILVVIDATNLRRNLFLLSEVLDLGRPTVVAVNMVDDARRAGEEVPIELLREATGVDVIETVATEGEGVDAVVQALSVARTPAARRWRFKDSALEEQLAAADGSAWERLQALGGGVAGSEAEVAARYQWISETLAGVKEPDLARLRERSDKIDRVIMHPVGGPLVFLLIMGLVFQSIFSWSEPLMAAIESVFGAASGWVQGWLPGLVGETFTALLTDGVIAGVGSVVVFLPQIVILFLLLGLLEDTGYMARAAFLVDRPLRALGLSGRSFIPLLSSFACAIPGVMATRTIPGRLERWVAIAVAPLMTCSARLPVYTLLIAAFVPTTLVFGFMSLQGLVLFGLYMAGIVAGGLIAFLASRGKSVRGKPLPMVVELPPFRRPTARGVLLKLRVRVGDFLRRAGTVILVVSIVLWALMSYPKVDAPLGLSAKEQAGYQLRESYAGRMGRLIEPAVKPLGYDWKMGVGLIASFAAREVFVSTMGVVYSLGDEVDEESKGLREALQEARDPQTGKKVFSLATVFSLLAFYVFALQCMATVAVVKRETHWRFAIGQLVGYGILAYLAALVTYQGMTALGYG